MNKTLYQLDRTGTNVKVWTITVTDNGSYSAIEVQSGRLGGNLISNTALVNEGKNIGKSNETTHFEQACAEAQAKIELKLREGYVPDIADAKASTVLGSGIPQPMLAQKHSPDGSQSSSKTLAQIGILGKEIVVQPKLDGNRCLIVVIDGEPKMYTRKGDLMPVQLANIINDVESKLEGDENIILDGELFSDEISFNTLNGLIKRITTTEEDRQARLMIKFNLYDVIMDKGYEYRMTILPRFASDSISIVPSTKIIATDENIKTNLEAFLEQGHEGLMIRQLGIGYENKRTWQLCKVKIFEDEEFMLVGLEEDVRGGFIGKFVLKMQDGTIFRAGASGQSVEERTEMLKNKDAYLNKMATVQFFGRSEYNVPRFPKFKGLR